MHTVFIGNGIIALTAAFRLLQRLSPSDKITIVGEKARHGSATLAAAAMLNSFAEIEVGALKSEIDIYKFELSRLASRMWPDFERAIMTASSVGLNGIHGNITFSDQEAPGTFVINNAAADDLDDENFDAIVDALKRYEEPFESVSPRNIPNYLPMQKYRATRAVFIPREGWYNPRLVMAALEAAFNAHPQVTLLDTNINCLIQVGKLVDHIVLDNGQTLTGDHFVLATGATVSDVLARSKLAISLQRVFYGVGTSLEIQSPDFPHTHCVRTPNRGLACGVYSAPYPIGHNLTKDHVLIGATNFISPTPYQYGRLTSVETLMRAAIEQINANFYRADLIQVNLGWRPTSQDTYPMIGKTSISNLVIATGTKRDGFHLSPVISEKIVAILCNEPIEEQFSWFMPERKPIKNLTREEAITKAVRHQMSASYQHGFSPATSRMPEEMMQSLREKLERLHDQVGAIDWGIPPEMLDMYKYGHTSN